MLKLLFLILLVTSLAVPAYQSSAKIYVWRNEKGVLVFSDTPKPGAEEVTTTVDETIQKATSVDTSVLDINPQIISNDFQVEINSPQPNTTIRDNTGSLYISGSIKPQFIRGFKVQLFLDGQAYKVPQQHTMFSLHNIDRGEHMIKLQLTDDSGKVIALSEPVTFYMHRNDDK